ncbi:MAG: cysteine-rich VLP domain-containing protein [Clostridiales bacterium]|nr:cysteine-rich VLP domain-containing protein [Clostridiales bacterium]
MEPRELTRAERAAIRILVASECANHDGESGCPPLDGPCYVLGKWWTGAYCKYFREAVLPIDRVLEAALLGGAAPIVETRPCAACGKAFPVSGRQSYCSAACQKAGNRKKSRACMQRKRDAGRGICYD